MSRFLVVVPPFTGHVNPVIGVAEELRDRGHEVAWAGDASVLARTLPGRWPVHDTGRAPLTPRSSGLRGFAALEHLWERVLIPLACWMEPGVRQAVARARPDVVLTDQQALAGALVSERAGIPWATMATTSSELVDPLAMLPQLRVWLAGLLGCLRTQFGDPAAEGDLRFSPHLVVAFSTTALVGDPVVPVHFVGPVRRRADGGGFPWDALDPARPKVLVTMGTENVDVSAGFLRECASALRDRPGVQGVFADPGHSLRDVEGAFVRVPWLPQQALLPHMAAVVCHAGHNTTCEALAQAVPLVLAPIRDDQPVVAAQVARAGAGVRLRFSHAKAAHIGKALDDVLTEPSFTAAARRVRDSFVAAGGACAAADVVERLV
ncbi:glycosyltransferase [Lentzea sp. JNUCC 0626]|uniref:glycosyltransferase n=1 Tax=Lentzea sp. JNUCC 0626 TaxID=3367513 RepID=UPI003748161C